MTNKKKHSYNKWWKIALIIILILFISVTLHLCKKKIREDETALHASEELKGDNDPQTMYPNPQRSPVDIVVPNPNPQRSPVDIVVPNPNPQRSPVDKESIVVPNPNPQPIFYLPKK